MQKFVYEKVSSSRISALGDEFCRKFGEPPHGHIPDPQFDSFYDHLATSLSKHGSFSEKIEDALVVDFSGCRLSGEPHPVVGIVPNQGLDPKVAVAAGLEAVTTSPRHMGVQFDFHPDYLLVCSPNLVYGSYELEEVAN